MIYSIIGRRTVAARDAPRLIGNLGRALTNVFNERRTIRSQRSIARALSALSDRTLNDIGIPRGMIQAAACAIARAHNEDRQA